MLGVGVGVCFCVVVCCSGVGSAVGCYVLVVGDVLLVFAVCMCYVHLLCVVVVGFVVVFGAGFGVGVCCWVLTVVVRLFLF